MERPQDPTRSRRDRRSTNQRTTKMPPTGTHNPSEYTWTYQQNESTSGAGILYRKNLRVTKPIEDTPRINTIAVKRENNTALWISSFYLQPETLEGLHDVQKVGIEAIKTDSQWILGGDANAHSTLWSQSDNNECGNRMEDWILENNLLVINDPDSEATFSRKSTQDQWLDITLSTQGISRQITEWQVKKEAIPNSDHFLIHWEIDGQDAKLTDLKQRSWAKTNWEEYRDLVQAFLPTLPLPIDSIARLEEQTHLLTKALSTAMKLTTKMVEPKKIPRNWFDQEAQNLHNRLRANKKGTSEHDAIRSEWKELVRNKKLLSFQKFTESTDDQNCWEALRRLSYPKKLRPIHTLTDQTGRTNDPKQMADLLAQRYFPELEPGIRTDAFRQQARKTRDKYSPTDGKPKRNTWSHREIWEELQRGRRKTSSGPDDIPYQAIRACADILTPWLTAIYNAVIDTGHVPRQWKVGKVCNIPKPGKSGEEAKHYRPITLLNCVSKIFEALVTKKISTWAEDKGVLPDSQYGFRKNRTTSMPLGSLTAKIWNSLNRRQKLTSVSVDLEGAYDRVVPSILIERLEEAGLDEDIVRVVWNLLIDREANITIEEESFSYRPERGLPQGSPVSPILYILYSASIPKYMPNSVHINMYADDIVVYKEITSEEDETQLQEALNGLMRWCDDSGMKINPEKTQTITFRRNRDQTQPHLRLGQHSLQHTETMKYLGITFDERMSFEHHLKEKTRQATQRIYGIRRMARALWGASAHITRRLYQMCIQPLMLYGSEIWIARLNTIRANKMLERIGRLGALTITGLDQTTSAETAMTLAYLQPLSTLATAQLLKLAPRIYKDPKSLTRSISPPTHCTPEAMLLSELEKVWQHHHQKKSRRQRPTEDELHQMLKSKDLFEQWYTEYLEEQTNRQWTLSNKSQSLKNTGWRRINKEKPWFDHPMWTKRKTTQINRMLSGHIPTLTYLQSRGREVDDVHCRLCREAPETRDHLLRCPALRKSRRMLFIEEDLAIEKFGPLLQEAKLFYTFDQYCSLCHRYILQETGDKNKTQNTKHQ